MKTPEAIAQECAEKAMELVRGWWLGRTSEENCLTTIVDVFTDMRNDLESDKLKPELSALIAAAIREATEQKDRKVVGPLQGPPDGLHEEAQPDQIDMMDADELRNELRGVLNQLAAAGTGIARLQMELDATVCAEQHRQVLAEATRLRALLDVAEGALKTANRWGELGAGDFLPDWAKQQWLDDWEKWDQALARIAALKGKP